MNHPGKMIETPDFAKLDALAKGVPEGQRAAHQRITSDLLAKIVEEEPSFVEARGMVLVADALTLVVAAKMMRGAAEIVATISKDRRIAAMLVRRNAHSIVDEAVRKVFPGAF